MFLRIREHLTPSTCIALLALVFALTGGAFAATGGGSSSPSHATLTATAAKSKPKAKTGPRGPAGPKGATGAPGATGPAGPAGVTGPAGPAGPTGPAGAGTPGDKGAAGESVTIAPAGSKCLEGGTKFANATGEGAACNGEPGAKGETGSPGSPWTVGGTLPSGATETGVWSARFTGEVEGAKGAEENIQSAISFTIPLKAALDAGHVHYANTLVIQEKFGAGAGEPGELCAGLTGTELSACEANGRAIRTACPGSAAEPTAQAGHLCLYEGEAESLKIAVTAISKPTSLASRGTGTAGAVANVNYPGVPEESKTIVGAWAVTAP